MYHTFFIILKGPAFSPNAHSTKNVSQLLPPSPPRLGLPRGRRAPLPLARGRQALHHSKGIVDASAAFACAGGGGEEEEDPREAHPSPPSAAVVG